MKIRMTFVGLLVALMGCGRDFPQEVHTDPPMGSVNGIFGGSPVDEQSRVARAIVGIRFVNAAGDPEICGGALLNSRTVITAAHCVQGRMDDIRVFFGVDMQTPNLDHGGELKKVARVRAHPRYLERKHEIERLKAWDQGNEFDVALLFLAEKAPKGAAAFKLASHEPSLETHPILLTAGFGLEAYNVLTQEREGAAILKMASLTRKESNQFGTLLFDQKTPTGVCVGDSGGPVFFDLENLILVGIASNVRNPGSPEVCKGESRFVSAPFVKPWIEQEIIKNP